MVRKWTYFFPRGFFAQWRGEKYNPRDHFLIKKTIHRTSQTHQNHTDETHRTS